MKKYQLTFKFFDSEKDALLFRDMENKSGTYYKRKKYPASCSPWTSIDGKEHKYVCLYWN